jgi:hypothetical protein
MKKENNNAKTMKIQILVSKAPPPKKKEEEEIKYKVGIKHGLPAP